jgi:putative Mg2+ transporter-C (MgtC) family protein
VSQALGATVPTLDWWEVAARLAVAAALGGAIGFERELRDREAGFRTHMLVCVGSALFTIVSAYGFSEFLESGDPVIRADPTRIAAQIVTGIGFLGAGAIIRQGLSIRGLTTAATLWVAAAIGIAAGAGFYSGAVVAVLITLLALWPLRVGAHAVFDRLRPEEKSVLLELRAGTEMSKLLAQLDARNVHVEAFKVEDESDVRIVTLTLDRPTDQLLGDLSDLEFVRSVHWHR